MVAIFVDVVDEVDVVDNDLCEKVWRLKNVQEV